MSTVLIITVSVTAGYGFFGGKIDNFAADMVMTDKTGEVISTNKLYVIPGAQRMEGIPGGQHAAGQMMSKHLSSITFTATGETVMLNHDKQLYYRDKDLGKGIQAYRDAETIQVLGKETVSGYPCEKKRVRHPMLEGETVTIWQNKRFDMPLKLMTSRGLVSQIKNIDKGSADEKMFEIPKGYNEAGNMMEAMGMDFGRMGDQDSQAENEMPETKKGERDTIPSMAESSQPTADSTVDTDAAQAEETKDSRDSGFKLPGMDGEDIQNTLKSLGNKIKGFKF